MSDSSYRDNYQLAWDNTSLGTLRTCARKYYYQNILGLRPKAQNPHLTFGILYHQALEHYDQLRSKGMEYPEAVRETVRYAATISADFESDHKIKNRRVLVRAVAGYLDHFRIDPAKTVILDNGQPAVELSFRFEINLENPFGDPYILSGHLDRIAEFDEKVYVLDRKTTSKSFAYDYMESYKPSGQMMQYTSGGKIVFYPHIEGVIIDAVYLATNLDTFSRFKASYTKAQLDEWLKNTHFYIKMAEQYRDSDVYPQNFEACHVYSGCQFRGICGRDPSVRDLVIKSDFVVDRWEPLKTRERSEST
jgi:RecB family exonuclease